MKRVVVELDGVEYTTHASGINALMDERQKEGRCPTCGELTSWIRLEDVEWSVETMYMRAVRTCGSCDPHVQELIDEGLE